MTTRPRIRTLKPELGEFAPRHITPDALADAEFCGLFWGEGSLDIVRQGREIHNIAPRARMALRHDDLPLLLWAQERFGGNLSRRQGRENEAESWSWQLTGRNALTHLLDVLDTGRLPAKKRLQVAVMREAVSLIKTPRGSSRALNPAVITHRFELQQQLRDLKKAV